jgi:hypothetical protein
MADREGRRRERENVDMVKRYQPPRAGRVRFCQGIVRDGPARNYKERKLTIGLEPITCCLQGSCSTN